MKKYYKVVRRLRNTYWSCVVGPRFRVRYQPGKLAFPKYKGSKLWVFEDLFDARQYCDPVSGEVIFECECVGISPGFMISDYPTQNTDLLTGAERRRIALRGYEQATVGQEHALDGWLPSTRLAEAVKLLEKAR